MPVVLFSKGNETGSDNIYDDRTGVSYEYPKKYEKLVKPGMPFVYHVPGSYVGAGIIGEIVPSVVPGRFVCEIVEYSPFSNSVSLKDPDGNYFEERPGAPSPFWSQGVRPLSTQAFEQIIWSAPPESPATGFGVSGYASPEVTVMVESISMGVAMNWLKKRYPDEIIVAMPHNNPGYDIRVGENSNPKFFVEVKGTQASVPVFWLSEGERKFSVANADSYIFLVVSGINLTGNSPPLISVRTGALEGSEVLLEPSQWRGQLSGITTQAS